MGFSAENLQQVEDHLANHQFLSGKDLPGADDLAVLNGLNKNGTIPAFEQFPNTFGWFWTLHPFSPPARALWGAAPAKGGKAAEAPKKQAKATPKPAPKADDEDDFDLFGDETEEDAKAAEDLKKAQAEKKTKKEKPAIIAKSLVTFDVKGFEEGQDFDAMATKIRDEIKMDGLVWMDKHKILEIAFGMKKLQMQMLIEDDKIQTDDVFEIIESWEDVQSTDIQAFAKA